MPQRMFKARIALKSGGNPLHVTISANDATQAAKLIEQQYGVKVWYQRPTPMK